MPGPPGLPAPLRGLGHVVDAGAGLGDPLGEARHPVSAPRPLVEGAEGLAARDRGQSLVAQCVRVSWAPHYTRLTRTGLRPGRSQLATVLRHFTSLIQSYSHNLNDNHSSPQWTIWIFRGVIKVTCKWSRADSVWLPTIPATSEMEH